MQWEETEISVSQQSGSLTQSVFSSKAGRKQPPWNFLVGTERGGVERDQLKAPGPGGGDGDRAGGRLVLESGLSEGSLPRAEAGALRILFEP